MMADGRACRTIWPTPDGAAIETMAARGAPLIGATAAYGVALALRCALEDGGVARVEPTPPGAAAANPAFDVTPAELIDGFITDRGLCAARKQDLAALFA